MRFVAHPCREVNGEQSYSIYKDGLPYLRPAENQIVDRSFASKLVKTCDEHFNKAVAGAKRDATAGTPSPEAHTAPTGVVA